MSKIIQQQQLEYRRLQQQLVQDGSSIYLCEYEKRTFCIFFNTSLNRSFFTSVESFCVSFSSSAQMILNNSCCFEYRSLSSALILSLFSSNHDGYFSNNSFKLGNSTSADKRLCIMPCMTGRKGLSPFSCRTHWTQFNDFHIFLV